MNPWGVEPQSKEPESFILSIELRVQDVTFAGNAVQNYGIFCNFATSMGKLRPFESPFCRVMDVMTFNQFEKMNVRIEPSWKQALASEWEAPYFSLLTNFVRQQYSTRQVFPPGRQIFAAFDAAPFDQVKVVILGQDPYHGVGQANGLCFSVNEGVQMPPSLVNIFKEVHDDVGAPMPASGDLSRWARQGVLLLNSTLTVEAHQPLSHQGKGWEVFTDHVIARLAEEREHLVFMLWGAYAKRKGAFIDRTRHLVLTAAHPSPLSANKGGFFGCRHFSLANAYLAEHGMTPIVW